jgi:hypothetical protein
VTCRSNEYAALVQRTGRPVPGAAVVEIATLTTTVTVSYLAGDRWSRVRAALASAATAHAPLVNALQTPLMLHLARTAYAPPRTDPAELLDTSRFPTSDAIEDHLLASYMPALYEIEKPRASTRSRCRQLRQQPATAVARLAYLARHTGDSISWWNLHEAVREWSPRVGAVAGVALVVVLKLLAVLSPFGSLGPFVYRPLNQFFLVAIAIVIGYVAPMPTSSNRRAPRPSLLKSIFVAGLPVSVANLLFDAFWMSLLVLGRPSPLYEMTYVAGPTFAVGIHHILFVALFVALFTGAVYAIGYEIGQLMQEQSCARQQTDRQILRRTVGACSLLMLLLSGFVAACRLHDVIVGGCRFTEFGECERTIFTAGELLTAVTVSIALLAFCIALKRLARRRPRSGTSGLVRRVGSVIPLGMPTGAVVSVSIAIYEVYTALANASGVYYESVIWVALGGASAGLMAGALAMSHDTSFPDAKLRSQPAAWAILGGLLAFGVVSAPILIPAAISDADSEGLSDWLIFGAVIAGLVTLLAMISSYLPTPISDLDLTEPLVALRRDRRAALLIIGAIVGINNYYAGGDGDTGGLALALTLPCIVLLTSSSHWPTYMTSRMLLRLDRVLPWRLIDFLADAHERGVLRRVGSVYQFRHIRIKENLAGSTTGR